MSPFCVIDTKKNGLQIMSHAAYASVTNYRHLVLIKYSVTLFSSCRPLYAFIACTPNIFFALFSHVKSPRDARGDLIHVILRIGTLSKDDDDGSENVGKKK